MGRFDHLEMGDWHSDRLDVDPTYTGVIDQFYYLEKANEAFSHEEFEKALAYYSRTLQYDINIEESWFGQLRCLVELGELPEAVMWSNRALERFPKSASILAARAVAESRQGRPEAAISYSDSAFASQGVGPYAWVSRGEVLISVNMVNARACFAKAVELATNDWAVRAWIARSYLVRKYHYEALSHLRQAVRLDPDLFTCWYWIGRCLRSIGQIEDAKAAYYRALTIKPSLVRAQDALRELDRRGPVSKAVDAFKRLFKRRGG